MVKLISICVVALGMFCFGWQSGNDWPSARGPEGSFSSPAFQSIDGEMQVLWRFPFASAVSPVVFGGKVFAHGRDEAGEVLVALDAFDGRLLWRFRFGGGYQTAPRLRTPDVMPLVDLETGNILVLSAGRQLFCVGQNGDLVWKHHLAEQFGFPAGFGRRRPVLLRHDGLVVCALTLPAEKGDGLDRLVVGINKNNGALRWQVRAAADPQLQRPPLALVPLPETPILFVGGFADGVRFIQPQTGRNDPFQLADAAQIRRFLMRDHKLLVHVQTEGGAELRCYDLARLAPSRPVLEDVVAWRRNYEQVPVAWASDGQVLVVMEEDGTLEALEYDGGRIRWRERNAVTRAASFVLIPNGVVVLEGRRLRVALRGVDGFRKDEAHVVTLPDAGPAPFAKAVPAYHRFYVQTDRALTALGPADRARDVRRTRFTPKTGSAPSSLGEPATLHIEPAQFRTVDRHQVRAFVADRHGRRLREVQPQWRLDGLAGTVDNQGMLQLALQVPWSGTLTAEWQGLQSEARVFRQTRRDILLDLEALPAGPAPDYWTTLRGMSVAQFDGGRVLASQGEGERDVWALFHGYAGDSGQVSGLVRARQRGRRLPEMGLYYRGFFLALMEDGRTLRLSYGRGGDFPGSEAAFQWEHNVWYHLKIEIQTSETGVAVRAKAWPQLEREPEHWLLEMTPKMGVAHGSGAGFFGRVYGLSHMVADNLWLRGLDKDRF